MGEQMKIKYGHSMIKSLNDKNIRTVEFDEKDLPDSIIQIIKTHPAFSSSSTFGQKGLGNPQEYEILIITDDNGTRQFDYFNKGIYYMLKGDKAEQPVFQVFANLMTLFKNE